MYQDERPEEAGTFVFEVGLGGILVSEASSLRGTVGVVSVESFTLPDVKAHPPGLRL